MAATADMFTYYGYTLGWATVRKLSEKQAYSLFQKFADRMWKRRGKAVLQYEKNVSRVVPEATPAQLRELSRECLRSYARYWCDAFRMPDWPRERILDLKVVGLEKIDAAFRADRGPVLVTPHGGNYDAGAAFVGARYGSVTTVAERLKPEKLFERFVAFRASLGVEVLPAGEADIVAEMVNRVDAGRIVGVVGERDLSRRGIPISFFGQEARMPAGPALIARRSGGLLVPASFYYEGSRPCAMVFDPIEVPQDGDEREVIGATTQAWADAISVGIRRHPGDWHMLQPLWTADLDPARDPMRRGGGPADAR